MRKITPLVLIAMIAAGCGPSTYTLKINVKKGDKFHYLQETNGVQQRTIKASIVVDKVEVGKTTIRVHIDSAEGPNIPQAAVDLLKKLTIIATVDSDGKVFSTSVEGGPKEYGGAANGFFIVFPAKAIKVGDTWAGNSVVAGKDVTTHAKLVKVDTLRGTEAAVVEVTMDVDGRKTNTITTATIEIATGMPLKIEAEAPMDPNNPATSARARSVLTRV